MKLNKNITLVIALAISLIAQIGYAQNVNISGHAYLENQTDHSGIKVYFEAVSPSAIEDSAFTAADGSYSKNIAIGIYNVHFSKEGYQPQEIPNQFFSEATVLDDITLPEGNVIYVSGSVYGTWTSNNIYVVTDSIYVASGNSLTIEPGTKVKFDGNYSFTISGYITADGEPGDSIIFTSNQSVPMPGDWGSIVLNYSPIAVFDYVKYEYASNGINGYGNQTGQVKISHSLFDRLHVDARGISIGNLDSSSQCYGTAHIKYNIIKAAGDWVLYAPYAQIDGQFIGNHVESTDGAGSGMYIRYSTNAIVDSNTVILGGSSSYGIHGDNSNGIKVRYNSVSGYRHSQGIRLENSNNAIIIGNNVNGSRDYGYVLNYCSGDSVIGNTYIWNSSNWEEWILGFYLEGSSNHFFKNNIISMNINYESNYRFSAFYGGSNNLFEHNRLVLLNNSGAGVNGIRTSNSIIKNNYIELKSAWSNYSISDWRSAIIGNGNVIENDTLVLKGWTTGIYGNNLTVKDVIIDARSGNNDEYGIYLTGSNNQIEDVTILDTKNGIYMESASSTTIRNNRIKIRNDFGIKVNSNSTPVIFKNNILGNNTGTGIIVQNNSTPHIRNNHIEDFNIGINASSLTNVCEYNNMYNVTTHYAGSGLNPQIGVYVTTNDNGTLCDIYWNINQEPRFFSYNADDSLYLRLMGDSPLINAGYPDSSDADGTVSDIGFDSYFHYLVIKHNELPSTNNTEGPYTVIARIYSPVGNQVSSSSLFYSTDGGNTYTEAPMTNTTSDTFQADIPGQPLNTSVNYYIYATDGTNSLTDPFDINNYTYSFFITMFSQFANLSGSSNTDGSINLSWDLPVPLSGDLTGLNLYKDNAPGVTLDPDHLLASLGDSVISYIDTNVYEGDTYYYKLSGLVDDAGDIVEVLASSEISVTSDNATIVRVRGTVQLQDTTDHSGVKVYFEEVSPSAVSDSMFTDSTGKVDIVMKTGIYNIHFTKDGYQPVMLGNRFLSSNTELDTIMMIPGGVQILSGDISGILHRSNLHYIDGDVTVPTGDTLIIEAGTVLKFRGDYNFNVNGLLLAEGIQDSHIVFTSGLPTPLEGDWKRIFLNNAPNSVLKYCDFYFAENGILLNESDNTEISYCTFDRFLLNAKGIEDGGYNNSDSLIITYNTFKSGFQRAVDLNNAYGSVISNNDILVTDWGIVCNNCDGSEFSYNQIYPGTDGYITGGIHSESSENSIFDHNTINGFRDYGIYFYRSSNSVVTNNEIDNRNLQGNYDNGEYCYGLYSWDNSSYSQNIIRNNTIYIHNRRDIWGIYVNYSLIDSNRIITRCNEGYNKGIRTNYSDIYDNFIFTYTNYGWDYGGKVIEAYADDQNWNEIKRNIIYGLNQTNGIWANNSIISDNYIYGIDDTLGYYNNTSNQRWGIIYGSGLTVLNNKIKYFKYGISVNGQNSVLKNNDIEIWGTTCIQVSEGNNTIIHNNSVLMDGGNTYGLRFLSGNASDVFQNTIASTGSPSGTGIRAEDNAHPSLNSNLIYGFATGIDAASDIYTLQFNNIYNYTTAMTGEGLPPQAGEIVTVNNNADPSDIYSNIFLDPLFVNLDTGNVNLQANSPCINAGDIDSVDVDGTIADIGACFYNFGYVPQHVKVDSTGYGFVALSWDITETDSLTGYHPYYKLHTSDTWISSATATEQHTIISDLTDNESYDFAVKAIYPNSESNFSKIITEKPGVVIADISPETLLFFYNTGDTVEKQFFIQNTGTKDLAYSLITDINLVDTVENISGFSYMGEFNDNLYYMSYNCDNWNNARTTCENNGGHLVTISSSEENEFIKSHIWDNVWIGFSDYQSEGNWVWVTGEPVIYTNWDNGEPNGGSNENYGLMYSWSGQWNDGGGDGCFPFVMEIDNIGETLLSQTSGSLNPGEKDTVTLYVTSFSRGIFTNHIFISSNDFYNPEDTVNVLKIVGDYTNLEPLHFTPVDTTEDVFYLIIDGGNIDGQSLQTGDEVGIFDGDICVGAGGFNGVFPFLIRAYGADGSPDGFSYGDSITVKLWDYSQSRYAVAQLNVTEGEPVFSSNGFVRGTIQGSVYETAQISLPANRFNLIATYLYPRYPNISSIFSGLQGLKIVYEDNGSAYIPEYNINSIGDMDITEGYHVFVAGNDQALTIQGLSIDPQNWTINIQPHQFNSIANLYRDPVSIENAFGDISAQVEIVQDDDGGVWIPSMSINTIGNIQPLTGYQIFTNVDTIIPFVYPEAGEAITKPVQIVKKVRPEHFNFSETGIPYTIIISEALIDNHSLEDGDEIAVFDGDLCAGATVWNSKETNLITAWKGDKKLDLQGYESNNRINFRIWSKRFKVESDAEGYFRTDKEENFEGSAYSLAKISANPGIIPQRFALKQNYPNPFNPTTTIPFEIAQETKVTISIFNLLGQEIARIVNNHVYLPGKYSVVWDGKDKNGAQVGSGIYFVYLKSDLYKSTQKMILIK